MKREHDNGGWKFLLIFMAAIVGVSVLLTWWERDREDYIAPAERALADASGEISGALQRYFADHGTCPEDLTDLPLSYLPSGFDASYLSRFTFTWTNSTDDSSSSWSCTVARKWSPNKKVDHIPEVQ